MCFSTTASFTAFVVLGLTGAKTLSINKRKESRMFAAIPLLFGVQQLTEGIVWLGLTHHSSWTHVPVYYFVFFAQVLWAVWVPLSILKIEENPFKRKIMKVCLVIGIILAAYVAFCMFFYKISANITHLHINYSLDFPHNQYPLMGLLYLIPIIIPPIISDTKWMKSIGYLLLSSMIFTKTYFQDEIISVWCFFAALISILVYFVIDNLPVKSKFSKQFKYSSVNLNFKV
jgi:hypothetical protein